MEIGLRLIVVINKIDRRDARIEGAINETYDLFLDLATHSSQLDFPIYYAIASEGKAWEEMPDDPEAPADLTPVFEGILAHIPPPQGEIEKPFQLLVAALDWDSFRGKYAIGRVNRGTVRPGLDVTLLGKNGGSQPARIDKVYVSQGLKRLEVSQAEAGDIVALTGIKDAGIGDTIADTAAPEALPTIEIGKPTLKMAVSTNTSPFAGREGPFVTGRQILERITRNSKPTCHCAWR